MNKLNFKTMTMSYLKPNFMKTSKFFIGAMVCLSMITSCSNDDDAIPEQPNEEEVITDVTLTLVNNANPDDSVELKSVDPDGEDGPLTPVVTVSGNLTAGVTYTATVDIYNSIEDEDITEEVVEEEPDEHFFVYSIDGLDIDFSRSANDVVRADGNALGYETTWVANSASSGSIRIQLFHESETVNDDNEFGTQSGGSTDIDITFTDIAVQ